MKNFLRSKPVEFYLRVIHKLSNKWLEVIQNNAGYTIVWNKLIVKLYLKNHISLKRQLFIIQTDIYK